MRIAFMVGSTASKALRGSTYSQGMEGTEGKADPGKDLGGVESRVRDWKEDRVAACHCPSQGVKRRVAE